MEAHPELPEDVIAAIEAGRKIEAIKLLREQWNLDLVTAKEAVEAYAVGRPGAPRPNVEGVEVPTASIDDLIVSKRTGRRQDAADIEVLEEIRRRRS